MNTTLYKLACAGSLLSVLILSACSGVTSNGPLAFMGDQTAAKITTRSYYPTGNLKGEVIVEGYNTTTPNPQLTAAIQSGFNTYTVTKGLLDMTTATVKNPNTTPPLAKDPNTLKKNPNIIPNDPENIPVNPNVIPE